MGKQAEAELQEDGKYKVTHADGTEELLTEKQFHDQYDVETDEADGPTPADAAPEANPVAAVEGTRGPDPHTITSDIDGGPIGSQGGDEDPPTLAKEHRPDTHNADDAFWGEGHDEDFVAEYGAAVEEELKHYEEGVKAVRAELKSLSKQKEEDRDFGALRAAMHDLAHGSKSLTRTAHPATVRHDGPERLRPAPTPEENVNSGPGEELNPINAAREGYEGRKVGR